MSGPERSLRQCDARVALAFSVLGKRWNGIIIDALSSGPSTFSSLRRSIGTITDAVLSERLSELAAAGLVERNVVPGPPVSVVYSLTVAGRNLVPLLQQLGSWAESNLEARPIPG